MMIASATPPTDTGMTAFIQIALVIFVVFFVGMLIWLFVFRHKGYQPESRIPLEDDRVMTSRVTNEKTHDNNRNEHTT